MKSFRSYFPLAWLCLCALAQSLNADLLDQWTGRTSGTTYRLSGVSYGNGTFVAVGGVGTILTSPDGVSWTTWASGTTNRLSAVTYGNGTFLAVGDRGSIETSPDGVSWTSRTPGTANPLSSVELYSVTYGNGTFVAVGGVQVGGPGASPFFVGIIATSPDGLSWTPRVGLYDPVYDRYTVLDGVAYGNGTFVAVGSGEANYSFSVPRPIIVTSPDGVRWTSLRTFRENYGLYAVTYGNGSFVTVGLFRTIMTSRDGVSWTSRTSEVISGSDSPDSLYGVTYGNGTFVAVGERGAILQTPMLNPLWLGLLPNGLIQINVAATPGKNYGIQASTNLVDWLLLTNLVSTDATVQFIDFGATKFSRRFYRTVLP